MKEGTISPLYSYKVSLFYEFIFFVPRIILIKLINFLDVCDISRHSKRMIPVLFFLFLLSVSPSFAYTLTSPTTSSGSTLTVAVNSTDRNDLFGSTCGNYVFFAATPHPDYWYVSNTTPYSTSMSMSINNTSVGQQFYLIKAFLSTSATNSENDLSSICAGVNLVYDSDNTVFTITSAPTPTRAIPQMNADVSSKTGEMILGTQNAAVIQLGSLIPIAAILIISVAMAIFIIKKFRKISHV